MVTLSWASKEILIKAVVQSIYRYVIGCFKLPKGLIKELHGLIARF